MILPLQGDQKKEAFRLFEDGRYQESLAHCNRLLEGEKDPALEVLAATNLYYTGRYEDAEVFFRDLAVRMPDSSYVHSYLAKVLEARGDEGAIAEYSAAVHLDPTNQDAVRGYAEYLLARKDYRGALPVLRRLVLQGKRSGDIRNLMRALIEIGDAEEALATHTLQAEAASLSQEYIDALMQTGNYRTAAESALVAWQKTKNPAFLRTSLAARSRYDPAGSLEAYPIYLPEQPDPAITLDYIRLLQSSGRINQALQVGRELLSRCPVDRACRLAECDLLALSGEIAVALGRYEQLVKDELASKDNIEELGRVIGNYRGFLAANLPPDEAEHRFLRLVSTDMNVASLLETARFYEERGKTAEARSWYYRAYRADFLAGGPDYALFLAGCGEDRECEKVMLYILSNVRKGADLARVASIIVREGGRMRTMKRLTDRLVRTLEDRRSSLSTEGLELLAVAFFLAASHASEENDYAGCKYLCLCGMDVMPAHARAIRLDDFLSLIRHSKEYAIADRPVMHARTVREHPHAAPPVEGVSDLLGLDVQEQKIVTFLRSHRTASERELRTLLGTRRVVGIVNRLVQKAASQGIPLIGKKGMGEDGEIYEYTGS